MENIEEYLSPVTLAENSFLTPTLRNSIVPILRVSGVCLRNLAYSIGYANKKHFYRVFAINFYLQINRDLSANFWDEKTLKDLFIFRISIISLFTLD